MDEIREIPYSQLIAFLEKTPDWKYVNARDWERNKHYGVFRDGQMISSLTLEFKKNHTIKFRCLVTYEQYKKQGVMANAIKEMMSRYSGYRFTVDCNDFSVGIFRKLGFNTKAVHHYSMWNSYVMYKEPDIVR